MDAEAPLTPTGARPGVLIAGATGLVGRELIAQALAAGQPVQALVRKAPALPDPRVNWKVVDMQRLPALRRVSARTMAFCALGTTIKVAGSKQAFRAVDFDAVLAFARAAKDAGCQRFAVVSALGADVRSANFYSRTKGEMEAALAGVGFTRLVIARPSLLAGDRASLGQPARLGERLALALTAPVAALIPLAWRPIQAATVARAMRQALMDLGPETSVLGSAELQQLGRL